MRMVIINSLPWAVGLQWTPPRIKTPGLRERAAMAVELRGETEPPFDLCTLRRKQMAFGVSGGPLEHWRNVRSLAGFVPHCPSFLGLFCLEDVQGEHCWWIFARQHGANVGTGDQVFSSYEDARREINVLSDLLKSRSRTMGSGQAFAEQVTCNTPEESLAWLSPRCVVGLLDKARGAAMLQPLAQGGQRQFAIWAGVAALACALVWGGNSYLEQRAEQRAMEEFRQAALLKAQHQQRLLNRPEEHFPQDWQTVPLADLAGDACIRAMLALPTAVSGWTLHSASCAGRSLTVRWAHTAAASFQALPVAARLETAQVAVTRATLSTPLQPRAPQPFARLLPPEAVKRFLYQLCQSTGTRLQLAIQPPEQTKVDTVTVVAPWLRGNWELSGIAPSDVLRGGLPRLLAELPGLTLDVVTLKNDAWTFQGRVYARNEN